MFKNPFKTFLNTAPFPNPLRPFKEPILKEQITKHEVSQLPSSEGQFKHDLHSLISINSEKGMANTEIASTLLSVLTQIYTLQGVTREHQARRHSHCEQAAESPGFS